MFNFKKRKLRKEIELHDKPYLDKPVEIQRNFRYKIHFDNGEIEQGECSVAYDDDLAEMFLRDKYTMCNNSTKFIYYNVDRILSFEAIEIRNKKGE